MARVKYTAKAIFEKEFKTTVRGFSREEVDGFLDEIMKDYDAYEAMLEAQRKEIKQLKEEIARQAVKVTSVQAETASKQEANPKSSTVTNFDILKRLNRLEKEVFGKKISETSAPF